MVPADLRYTNDHEWIRLEGDDAVVGITAYAAEQLGDIVFVELPAVGRSVEQAKAFGVVESVKAVSDLYAPVSGEVVVKVARDLESFVGPLLRHRVRQLPENLLSLLQLLVRLLQRLRSKEHLSCEDHRRQECGKSPPLNRPEEDCQSKA